MRKISEQTVGHLVGSSERFLRSLGLGGMLGTIALLALLHNPGQAFGAALPGTASVVLGWDPNPEPDIIRYEVSYGLVPGDHPNIIDSGASTTASVTGLVEGTTYYFQVSAWNQAGLQSAPSAEMAYLVPVTQSAAVTVIPQTGWSLRYVDSQALNGYAATRAFDGDPNTIWATDYLNPATLPPHEIQIDLGASYPVGGFRYLPRQDAYTVGNIGQYEFYVSADGTQWGAPVATGTFDAAKTEKEVLFTVQSARYVRLRVISEITGDANCAMAEINVLQGTLSQPSAAPTLGEWAAAANLTGLNADPLATPQNDGIPNLLKYAFGMNGGGPDVRVVASGTGTAGLPFIMLDRSSATPILRFEYLRRKNSTLAYTPRKSLDLKTWLPISATLPESVTDIDAEWERVVYAEPCDTAAPVCFGRVEVAMP